MAAEPDPWLPMASRKGLFLSRKCFRNASKLTRIDGENQ